MQSITAFRFVTKAPYTTHHCDLYALVGWPSLHTRRQTHWLQVIYKSLLGKAPPYLSSLVKNLCSWRLISPSLALSASCQSSSQITAPVHSTSVNSPSIYLIPILYLFIYLVPLHQSISTCTFIFCTSTIPVFNCYIVITSPPWPIYCLKSLI